MKQHIIHVERGSAADIEAAIREYESLSQQNPIHYLIRIYRTDAGSHLVAMEQRMHPYYVNNLTSWLNDVGGAMGWWEGEHECWNIVPDADNPAGDTAYLIKPNGDVLTSYLPGNEIYPSPTIKLRPNPRPGDLGSQVAELTVEIEDLGNDNNPRNAVTDESAEKCHARLSAHFNRSQRRVLGGFALVVTTVAILIYGVVRMF